MSNAAIRQGKKKDWRTSKEKIILYNDIISKRVTDDMQWQDVYHMHEEYKDYDPSRFRDNFRALKLRIKKSYEDAASDHAALTHDQVVRPRSDTTAQGTPQWDGSTAMHRLIEDVTSGRHKMMTPATLWRSRTEYQSFPLKIFRSHIHQETRSRLERAYWDAQKKKKKERKLNK